MRTWEKAVVFILSVIFTLILYAIVNTLIAGAVFLIISILNDSVALAVYKWMSFILWCVELLFTVPAVVNYLEKEKNK